jgi:hypothetical protein
MTLSEREHGRPGFLQPCPQLGVDGCGCYAERPQACADYRCSLLDEHAAGRSLGECLDAVAEMRSRVRDLERAMDLPHGSFGAAALYDFVRRERPLDHAGRHTEFVTACDRYLAFAAEHFQAPAGPLAAVTALVASR